MAKVEIKVGETTLHFNSANDATEYLKVFNGWERESERIKRTQIPAEPQPSYSRQTVLREEHCSFDREIQCYCIHEDNSIWDDWHNGKGETFSYAPTRELAEEIVQIREGEWVPKFGDGVYICFQNDLGIWDSIGYETMYRGATLTRYHYFPSEKQCTSFIEKQKEKNKLKDSVYSAGFADGVASIEKNKPKEEVCGGKGGSGGTVTLLYIEKIFKIGDVVILKPNAMNAPRPPMVVHYFSGGIIGGTNNCVCRWFDEEKKLQEAEFNESELQLSLLK